MRARCISFPPEVNPEALFQIVQHETTKLALQPRFMTHQNGALDLSAAILCVEDPADVAARYAHYADRHVDHRGSLHIVQQGTAQLVVIKPEHLPVLLPGETAPTTPYFAGFTVTADLDLTSTFLNHRAIPFRSHDGRIIISGGEAFGSAIVFERPHAAQPGAISRGGADHD